MVPGYLRANASATGKPTYPRPMTAIRSAMCACSSAGENIAFSPARRQRPQMLPASVPSAAGAHPGNQIRQIRIAPAHPGADVGRAQLAVGDILEPNLDVRPAPLQAAARAHTRRLVD